MAKKNPHKEFLADKTDERYPRKLPKRITFGHGIDPELDLWPHCSSNRLNEGPTTLDQLIGTLQHAKKKIEGLSKAGPYVYSEIHAEVYEGFNDEFDRDPFTTIRITALRMETKEEFQSRMQHAACRELDVLNTWEGGADCLARAGQKQRESMEAFCKLAGIPIIPTRKEREAAREAASRTPRPKAMAKKK